MDLLKDPILVSFSGGRSSAFMLYRLIQSGIMENPNAFVVFADTGKERPETYDFVRACSENWGVRIHWVERPGKFDKLIEDRKYLPNPVTRFCTGDLKVKPMLKFMKKRGFRVFFTAVGIRADEPLRIAKMRAQNENPKNRQTYFFPLLNPPVNQKEVIDFWDSQPFDLAITSMQGNCDFCFMKSNSKLVELIKENEAGVEWWIEKEKQTGSTFKKDTSFEWLLKKARAQKETPQTTLDFDQTSNTFSCFCGD